MLRKQGVGKFQGRKKRKKVHRENHGDDDMSERMEFGEPEVEQRVRAVTIKKSEQSVAQPVVSSYDDKDRKQGHKS